MIERKNKLGFSNLQDRVDALRRELELCKEIIKKLKNPKLLDSLSELEKCSYQRRLEAELRKKEILTGKLVSLGAIVEKRGRPKKEDEDKYRSNHLKFTAMLSPINLYYLRKLKKEGKIANISAFLDELVENYRKNINR